jgi:hypothetical protein
MWSAIGVTAGLLVFMVWFGGMFLLLLYLALSTSTLIADLQKKTESGRIGNDCFGLGVTDRLYVHCALGNRHPGKSVNLSILLKKPSPCQYFPLYSLAHLTLCSTM